jgi:NAD(P)-dependent dehydrogenase (short-subunit alcohol dehydrogenase family)
VSAKSVSTNRRNDLMWDSGRTPTCVIDHGVLVADGVRYSGELPRGLVVVNNICKRGRRLGLDVFERARREIPLDLVGMGWEPAGGLREVRHAELPAFAARYRFFFNPIRYTSLGLAGCEAMMLGMPIIGLATTEMVTAVEAALGYEVDVFTRAAADLKQDLADKVAGSLRDEGKQALGLALDVGREQQADQAIRRTAERFGRLDVLVNNAGTDKTVSVEELTFADWDRVLTTNLRGPFVLSKLAFPVLRQQGRGHIVNVVSTAAKRTWANAAAYHASKWGLLGLSHALHVEGRKHNIKVTAVIAGGMRTPFILDRFPDTDPGVLQDPKNVAETIRFVLTQPDETVIPEVMVIPMRESSWP